MALLKVSVVQTCYRCLSRTAARAGKVAVLGSSGGIGQPLSLLLKTSPWVKELSLYDINHAFGVAADLSHIDVPSKTSGWNGPDSLKAALTGAEIVVIPAGVPRKPGMSRDDLFSVNASIVRGLILACAKACPAALIAIITNPVNSVVPIAAEALKERGVFDPRKLFGVTTLDLVRASTFVGSLKHIDPRAVKVPCIGGHSGTTIVPLLSQTVPKTHFSPEEVQALTARVQEAGTEVVKAKGGAGSATLSMAYAASRFVTALCKALAGETGVVECSFVTSSITELKYFSSPVLLGKDGVMEVLPLPSLSHFESEALTKAIPELKKNIEKGEKFKSKV